MTTTGRISRLPGMAARRRSEQASRDVSSATGTESGPRDGATGLVVRVLDRLTRRWTIDLYDVDFQFESLDLEAELMDRHASARRPHH